MDCNDITVDRWLSACISAVIMMVALVDTRLRGRMASLGHHAFDSVDSASQRWFGRWWLLKVAACAVVSVFIFWPRPLPAVGAAPLAIAVGSLFGSWRRMRALKRAGALD